MWFWYLAVIVVICLVVVGLVLFWSIFISKPEEPKESSVVPLQIVNMSEVRTWFIKEFSAWRPEEVVADNTPMEQYEVTAMILVVKDKYNLNVAQERKGVFHLIFPSGNIFEFEPSNQGIRTVGRFIEMLGMGFNFRQNKPKSQAS